MVISAGALRVLALTKIRQYDDGAIIRKSYPAPSPPTLFVWNASGIHSPRAAAKLPFLFGSWYAEVSKERAPFYHHPAPT